MLVCCLVLSRWDFTRDVTAKVGYGLGSYRAAIEKGSAFYYFALGDRVIELNSWRGWLTHRPLLVGGPSLNDNQEIV